MSENKITLGGTSYTFEAWTVDQLERMGDLQENLPPAKVGFAVFAMAIENATPAVEDVKKMRVAPADIAKVINLVNTLSGLVAADDGGVVTVGEQQPKA